MRLQEALFNWLQIQIVWDARPSDRSAQETVDFFRGMLEEDHQVHDVQKRLDAEQDHYTITYTHDGEVHEHTFPREQSEKLLQEIVREPKYNQSFE